MESSQIVLLPRQTGYSNVLMAVLQRLIMYDKLAALYLYILMQVMGEILVEEYRSTPKTSSGFPARIEPQNVLSKFPSSWSSCSWSQQQQQQGLETPWSHSLLN